MKRMFTLTFLFVFLFSGAQNQRFYYEYKFIPNTAEPAEIKTEMMQLDTDRKGSTYYSYKKFVADSTTRADLEKQMRSGTNSFSISRQEGAGDVAYSVTKTYPDYQVVLHTPISSDLYKIPETQKPEWNILAEKEKIGEYNVQKATANFGGRTWTAWFTTEIPIQDGPYKFYGLPGLIVKIQDQNGSHIMTLVGNRTVKKKEEQEIQLPEAASALGYNRKEIEVSREKFSKLWKEYANDPSKNMREMMMKNSENSKMVFKFRGPDGKETSDPNQVFRAIDERVRESIKKNNNPIEPDLYQ